MELFSPVTGFVFDIRKFSIQDGPGIRTTVFMKGCPLSCWWCHNPESQSTKPELIFRQERCIRCGTCRQACASGAILWQPGEFPSDLPDLCTLCGDCADLCAAEARQVAGWTASVAEVMAEIEADIAFYDESGGGATFSGGEPLLQRRFLLECLRACRAKGIHTVVDTCGFASWETFESIRQLTDLFLYDLKLMDSACHQEYTGVPNEPILENLRRLAQLGHPLVIRVPVIPGITAEQENIDRIGAFVAGLPGSIRVDILPYHHSALGKYERLHRAYRLLGTRPPSEAMMQAIAHRLEGFGLEVRIGG